MQINIQYNFLNSKNLYTSICTALKFILFHNLMQSAHLSYIVFFVSINLNNKKCEGLNLIIINVHHHVQILI